MAIAKIKKIEIIGLSQDRDNLLVLLQKIGLIELIKIQEESPVQPIKVDTTAISILEVEEAISYLAGFQEQAGLLEGMVKLRPLVYEQELKEVVTSFDYQGLLKNLSELRNHLKDLIQHKERLIQERHILAPWENLKIPLEQIHSTQNCGIILGILRTADYENLLENCKKEKISFFSDVIRRDQINTYIVMLYLKNEVGRLETILKDYHFNFVTLARHKGTVEDRILKINREVLVLEDQTRDAKAKILELSKQQFKLMVVYDYLANIERRCDAQRNIAGQQFTFILSGWIREKDIRFLNKEIADKFSEMAVFISQPSLGEDIPISFENKPIIKPFEAVTNLYGQPRYSGLDPTAFLAPFFAISFGFCMMDAGYGLVLFLLMMFYLKKKQITSHGRNLLRLFVYASIATIFAGLITGNFFADSVSRLPAQFDFLKTLQKRIVVFDPIKDSLLFLGITLAIGYIQIWSGVFIKFMKDMRQDKFAAFILDMPTLLIQTSLLILALIFAKILPEFMFKFSLAFLFLSCVLVIYYQWKSNPDLGQKIFWSIFGIYAIVTGNFLADTLSFSRIFALGITGGLLGMAINEILLPKSVATNIPALIGAIIAFIIWFVVQGIIMAINLLGAYVQTSRLQYLEFFTKFFESGGRPFKPFREETKYIFLAEK